MSRAISAIVGALLTLFGAVGHAYAAERIPPWMQACAARLERARVEGAKLFPALRNAEVHTEGGQVWLRAEDSAERWILAQVVQDEDPRDTWPLVSIHPDQPWLYLWLPKGSRIDVSGLSRRSRYALYHLLQHAVVECVEKQR